MSRRSFSTRSWRVKCYGTRRGYVAGAGCGPGRRRADRDAHRTRAPEPGAAGSARRARAGTAGPDAAAATLRAIEDAAPVILTIAIVVAFNAPRGSRAAAWPHCTAAPPDCPHDIVVVDNGSTDGAPEMVRDAVSRRSGCCARQATSASRAANNIALPREHAASWSCCSIPTRSCQQGPSMRWWRALDASIRRPRPSARASWTATAGRSCRSAPMPSPWGEAWQRWRGRLAAARVLARARVGRGDDQTAPRTVAWVSGACLLVRRADAVAVGLLDERFFLYWEDVDFCAALRAAGRRIRFTPAVEMIHLRGRSAVGVRRGHRARLPARTAGVLSQVAARAGRPCLRWYLRVRGQHPDPSAEAPPARG